MSKAAADRLAAWRPLGLLQDLAHCIADTRRIADENRTTLTRMESLMADQSDFLNGVAADMAELQPAIVTLVDENASLRAQLAETEGRNLALEAEDASETSAAQNVATRWNAIAERFTSTPEVPDVEPLPEPAPVEEPTPGDEV